MIRDDLANGPGSMQPVIVSEFNWWVLVLDCLLLRRE